MCWTCARKLEKAIAELPADVRDLQLVAARQARGPMGLGHGRQWDGPFEDGSLGDAPWEFAPGAADQVWALNNTVLGWARHISESRGIDLPRIDRVTTRLVIYRNRAVEIRHFAWPVTIETLCCWLIAALDSMRMDEAAEQIFDEFTGLHVENERWILGRTGAEKFAGRCDAAQVTFQLDDTGELMPVAAICGAALYGREGDADVRCQVCGMKYPLAARLAEMLDRQINDQLARAHTIANGLTTMDEPLSPTLLRKWIQRDADAEPSPEGPACESCGHRTCSLIRRALILRQGFDEDGHALYRVGDVRARLALVQQQRGMKLSA